MCIYFFFLMKLNTKSHRRAREGVPFWFPKWARLVPTEQAPRQEAEDVGVHRALVHLVDHLRPPTALAIFASFSREKTRAYLGQVASPIRVHE